MALTRRLERVLDRTTGQLTIETERLERVFTKTARGLWAFEMAEPSLGQQHLQQ